MTIELIRYNEPLDGDELAFLYRKEERERKQFYKITRIFMVLSFICPFIVAWFRAAEGVPNPFSYVHYFVGVLFLLCFSGAGIYLAYHRNLKKVQKDIKLQTKTIELTHITRKQYMPQNNTYFFYLDSPNKLSIEVNQEDYQRLDIGDEVNIEYTTYAKLYLGYF